MLLANAEHRGTNGRRVSGRESRILLASEYVARIPQVRRDDVRTQCCQALRRSQSYSAVRNGPFTVDVLLELNNDELLITDYALDEIAD